MRDLYMQDAEALVILFSDTNAGSFKVKAVYQEAAGRDGQRCAHRVVMMFCVFDVESARTHQTSYRTSQAKGEGSMPCGSRQV